MTKYRDKGWSEAKIQRAIASRSATSIQSAGLRDDVLDLITQMTNDFGRIRLSLHWYSDQLENDNFDLSDEGEVILDDFRKERNGLKGETTLVIKK